MAREILLDFKGALQVDGYAGYNGFCISEYIKRIGCWAHVRRKFKDVQVEYHGKHLLIIPT